MTTTSASAASSVASNPACSRRPAIRSESWTFIWQPNVSMRYFLATFYDFRLSPFAFPPPGKHLLRRSPQAVGDPFAAEHAGELFDSAVAIQPDHGRPRAAA